VAEHWIYLASIGFLLFVAACALALPVRWHRCAGGVACAAIVVLGVRTVVRAGDWVDAETFCQRTIASGGASPRLLATLASTYAERGQLDAQERVLRRTIERFPEFTPARIQLGACLQRQGRASEAGALLAIAPAQERKEARQYASTWQAALHLARLRSDAGSANEAIDILATARERFPETWPLAEYHARLLLQARGAAAALAVVEDYAAARWWHLEAWQMLGELRAETGATEAALVALRHAARLDLYDPRPLQAIARIELSRGLGDAALAAQRAAIRRQPERGTGYLALAAIFEELGRRSEAAAAVQAARGLTVRM
jgi:tetratricopeptide (TPR) repeat protein